MVGQVWCRSRKLAAVCVLSISGALGTGCGSEGRGLGASGTGPAPAPSAAPQPQKVEEIVLILPGEDTPDRRLLIHAAEVEAGSRQHVVFRAEPLPEGEPPARQADLIRKAVDDGASALIVTAAEPDAVAPMLAQVREEGVPVVLLETPVRVPGQDLPLVRSGALEATADRIIDALVDDARIEGFEAGSQAVLLVRRPGDDATDARVAALEKALKKARVPLAKTIADDGKDEGKVRSTLTDLLDSDPSVRLVVVDGDREARIAADVMNDLVAREEKAREEAEKSAKPSAGPRGPGFGSAPKARFLIGGFVQDDATVRLARSGHGNALARRDVEGMARLAVQTAVKMVRGETPAPDRLVQPLRLHRREGPSPGVRNWIDKGMKQK